MVWAGEGAAQKQTHLHRVRLAEVKHLAVADRDARRVELRNPLFHRLVEDNKDGHRHVRVFRVDGTHDLSVEFLCEFGDVMLCAEIVRAENSLQFSFWDLRVFSCGWAPGLWS